MASQQPFVDPFAEDRAQINESNETEPERGETSPVSPQSHLAPEQVTEATPQREPSTRDETGLPEASTRGETSLRETSTREDTSHTREQSGQDLLAAPTAIDWQRQHSNHSSSSSQRTQDDDHNSHKGSEAPKEEHGVLDKLRTAADDVAPGVVEKIRTAAHKVHFHSVKAEGVSRFLNPTTIRMQAHYGTDPTKVDSYEMQQATERALLWRARDNRKGRNSIAVPMMMHSDGSDEDSPLLPLRYTPRLSTKLSDISHTLWRMCTIFPYWDMAFWSGWSYTVGSALFVADGALAWGPVAFGDDFESKDANTYGGSMCFFFGALFYQVGAVAAYLEAVNDGSFHGSAMRRLLDGQGDEVNKKLFDDKVHAWVSRHRPHRHHHGDEQEALHNTVDPEAGWRTKEERHLRPGSIYPTGKAPAPRRGGVDMGGEEGDESTYATWRWWPSWRALREHHVYEMGYIACAIQLLGVTLYGVTAIVNLPGVLSSLAKWQELGAYWVPQIVASMCFLIASIMFAFETQEKWWKPEPAVLGWWIGVWSIIGSVGFLLCAVFGIPSTYGEHHWAEYQSDLSSMWGSAAYLTGSFLQWYEALSKNPLEELFTEPGEMKSHQVHPI